MTYRFIDMALSVRSANDTETKYFIIWIGGSDERYSNTVLVNNKIVPLKKQLMYSLKQEASLIVLEFTISVHSSPCNYIFFGLFFYFLILHFALRTPKK